MKLRPYQSSAVSAAYAHLRTRQTNPCIVLPTGTGKSVVIAQIVSDVITFWSGRVLILAHVKELLEQNAGKIKALCPEIPIGIFSAGLKSRDTDEPVIIAGIQSVYEKACDLGAFDLIIVDEAHLIPPDGDGMYRTFLQDMKVINPRVRVLGLTATPFRLKGGLICRPDNVLNEICYEAGLKEMIDQGFLSPLISRSGITVAPVADVHIRGGEFVAAELEKAMDNEMLVLAACKEIVQLTVNRKSVLIFTAGVTHCQHVAAKILELSGEECAIVTGDTPAAERAEIISRFKGETLCGSQTGKTKPQLKFLANVNVLTTGFDAPNTDCVVLLRPTNSAGLLIQMIGRGTRLSPETGKTDCLVLDYGENILRHGPVDMVEVRETPRGEGEIKKVPAKKCPHCRLLIHAACGVCPGCGYVFPPPTLLSKITGHASHEEIISGKVTRDEYIVCRTSFDIHEKRNAEPDAPKTLRIDYLVSATQVISEWVCPEHKGYARRKFESWWKDRTAEGTPIPDTATEAYRLAVGGVLAPTMKITVRTVVGEKYGRVVAHELGTPPVPVAQNASEDGVNDDIPF